MPAFLPVPSSKVENAHQQKAQQSSPQGIWAVSWTPESIVTGATNGSMKVWDINNDKIECVMELNNKSMNGGITSIATTRDGSMAIACHQDSTIRFFDLFDKKDEVACKKVGLLEAWSVCLSPGDDVLASGNNRGAVNIWSMNKEDDYRLITSLETNNKFILSTCFSNDGKLASASIDGVVNLFDLHTQTVAHKLKAHALPIRSIVFSPNGDLLYTASDDRHVSVYDLKSGQLVNSFSHAGMALVVDSSPDCRHFAVGGADCSVSLWDLGMQRLVSVHNTHKDNVWGLRFDKAMAHVPNSGPGRFVSVGDDSTIQVYE